MIPTVPFVLSVAERSSAKSKHLVEVPFDFAPPALRSGRTENYRATSFRRIAEAAVRVISRLAVP